MKYHFWIIKISKTKENIIVTDIFYKKTDTHQYLHFGSCHPRHTKTNIPFNLARRICTIVSDKELRNKHLNELYTMLISRNYPPELIKAGIQRAEKIDIEDLRKLKSKSNENETLPFVFTHNPPNGNFSPSIKERQWIYSLMIQKQHIFFALLNWYRVDDNLQI